MKSPPTDRGPHQKRSAEAEPDARSTYVSPLKRVKDAIASKPKAHVFESADDLKAFMRDPKNDLKKKDVTSLVQIKARVVWTTFEECRSGPVARIHLTDLRANDSLPDMYKVFRDKYKTNKMDIDKELITASVYGVVEQTKGVPKDGKVVRICSVWGMGLFLNESCQVTTSLDSIKVEPTPSQLFP